MPLAAICSAYGCAHSCSVTFRCLICYCVVPVHPGPACLMLLAAASGEPNDVSMGAAGAGPALHSHGHVAVGVWVARQAQQPHIGAAHVLVPQHRLQRGLPHQQTSCLLSEGSGRVSHWHAVPSGRHCQGPAEQCEGKMRAECMNALSTASYPGDAVAEGAVARHVALTGTACAGQPKAAVHCVVHRGLPLVQHMAFGPSHHHAVAECFKTRHVSPDIGSTMATTHSRAPGCSKVQYVSL